MIRRLMTSSSALLWLDILEHFCTNTVEQYEDFKRKAWGTGQK